MASLRECVESQDLKAEIRLSLRSKPGRDKIWILVEGIDDEKVYSKFFRKDRVKIKEVPGSCLMIETVVPELNDESGQVIGIKDADFIRLHGETVLHGAIFITDQHDLEMMMLKSDRVLENIDAEYSPGVDIFDIRNEILNQASFIGYIRWFNDTNQLQICFKGISHGSFYDGDGGYKKEKCVSDLNLRSSNKTREITLDEINTFIQQFSQMDLFQLCNGHDASALFALRLTKLMRSKGISYSDFQKSLRLSYQKGDFVQTNLHASIKAWADANSFDILL